MIITIAIVIYHTRIFYCVALDVNSPLRSQTSQLVSNPIAINSRNLLKQPRIGGLIPSVPCANISDLNKLVDIEKTHRLNIILSRSRLNHVPSSKIFDMSGTNVLTIFNSPYVERVSNVFSMLSCCDRWSQCKVPTVYTPPDIKGCMFRLRE